MAIDEANRGDSPIRVKQLILDAPSADDKKMSVRVGSSAAARLGLADFLRFERKDGFERSL